MTEMWLMDRSVDHEAPCNGLYFADDFWPAFDLQGDGSVERFEKHTIVTAEAFAFVLQLTLRELAHAF